MNISLYVARRYLRSKQTSGFVSVIAYMAVGGVVLGVAALVIILSVTNGFSGEIKNRLVGMNAHINIRRFDGGAIESYRELVNKVQEWPEVTGAAPVVDSKVIIVSKRDFSRIDGIPIWGIDPATFPAVSDLPKHLQYDERNEMWPFLVTDHFESGMYQYDDNYAFIHIEDAQRILGLGDAVTDIHLHVSDIYRAPAIRAALAEEFDYPYTVSDWTQLFPEFFRWIELEKWAIFIALSLIVLVAAFNIMSILVMSVLIKTPEIGILRAMGCSVGEIYRTFVYQGLIIGGAGTTLGCLIGFAVCYAQQRFQLISIPGDVYLINSLPVDMNAIDFVLVVIVSMTICLLTSVYPARKAASLMPVQAIRYIM